MPRRHDDFDAILIGDPREGRESAEMLLAAGSLLERAGLRAGLVPFGETGGGGPVLPGLAEAVRGGRLELIEEAEEPLRARLAIVAGVQRLALAAASLPPLRARRALVLVPDPVLDRRGRPRLDAAAAAALIAARVAPEQLWCPGDARIRAELRGMGLPAPIDAADWPPVVDPADWRLPRPAAAGRRIVLGHASGRGVDPPAADRAGLLARYPVADDLIFRLYGPARELAPLADPLPPGWQIIDREEAGCRRFLARLDFLVLQGDRAPGTAPRGLLEALAAGRVAILGPAFRPLLGDGLAYRTPEQVADTARYLQAEPAFYARYVAAQDRLLERHAPAALWERLRPFLAPAGARLRPARPARPAPRRIAFYPTNGIGLGHVTRLLAVARRLDAAHEPVFFTPCHALAVIENAGYRTEYVSEPAYDATAPQDHARAMAPRLARAFRYHEVGGVVFDGNVPRQALILAAAERDLPFVWVRRGMWRADPGLARFLELGRHVDAVIEPSEAAAGADQGVTARGADGPVRVPPVLLLDPGELSGQAEARAALRLPPDRVCALVQLGSGNNRDTEELLDSVLAAGERLGIELLVAEWLISRNPVRRRGVRYLAAFPNARHLNAFDFVVSAAGYNSFHELLHYGVPAIFLPNDDQQVDDQRARAAFADRNGAGICVPRGAEAQIGRYMEIMLDRAHRRLIAGRARSLCPTNGARAAAAAIEAVMARG